MTDELNRAELDTKLETIEARMDARVAVIEGKIDAALTQFRSAVSYLQVDIGRLRNLNASIWGAAATVIAVVLSVMGLAGTVFEAGRNTSEVAREAARKEVAASADLMADKAVSAAVIALGREQGEQRGLEGRTRGEVRN